MAAPAEFERRMVEIGLTAKRNAVVAVRRGFVAIAKSLGADTPADVGTAVSNWIASTGAPSSEQRPAFAPGRDGSTKGENAAAMVALAEEIAAAYSLESMDTASLWLANNTRQIGFLNAGSSKQAPALFVEAAVAKGAAAAKLTRLL